MYLYGPANKACSCCFWIRNFNIPQGPAPLHLGIWTFWDTPDQILLLSSAKIPAGSHCPPRASFFFLPSFPTIHRGLGGGKRNSPYTLRSNVVAKWLSQRRNVLKILWCVDEKQMFRTSKSKSGLYRPVMIIYFLLIKLGELYVSEWEPVFPQGTKLGPLLFLLWLTALLSKMHAYGNM